MPLVRTWQTHLMEMRVSLPSGLLFQHITVRNKLVKLSLCDLNSLGKKTELQENTWHWSGSTFKEPSPCLTADLNWLCAASVHDLRAFWIFQQMLGCYTSADWPRNKGCYLYATVIALSCSPSGPPPPVIAYLDNMSHPSLLLSRCALSCERPSVTVR